MRHQLKVSAIAAVLLGFYLGAPLIAQEQKAEEKKAEEKKGPEKVAGDIGLLDMEKNYMIVVTKEGKLITLDFDQKTRVIVNKEEAAKMADVASALLPWSNTPKKVRKKL
jgi:hypothetical protein